MSDEIPPFLVCDDPFEILGAEPTADEVALKRAYVARIKLYRPDRHPTEFKRIQAAYDRAQLLISAGADDVYRGIDESAPAHEERSEASPLVAMDGTRIEITGGGFVPNELPAAYDQIIALILAGRWSDSADLLEEVDRERGLALGSSLDGLRLRVAWALSWTDPERAEQVCRHLDAVGSQTEDELLADLLWDLGQQRADLDSWRPPAPLAHFFAVLPLFETHDAGPMTDELERDMADRNLDYVDAFCRLASRPGLANVLADMLGSVRRLDGGQQERIVSAMALDADMALISSIERIEKDLDRDRSNQAILWGLGAAVVVQVWAHFHYGWWALVSLVVLLAAGITTIGLHDGHLYRRIVRPWLYEQVIRHNVEPSQVARSIASVERLSDNIGRFKDDVEEDDAGHILFLVCRTAKSS